MVIRGQEFIKRNAQLKLDLEKFVEEHRSEIEQQVISTSDVVAIFQSQAPKRYIYPFYNEIRKEKGLYYRKALKKTIGIKEFLLERVGEPHRLADGQGTELWKEFTDKTGSTIALGSFRNELIRLGYSAKRTEAERESRDAQMKAHILEHKEDLERGRMSLTDLVEQLYGMTESDLTARELTRKFVRELGIKYVPRLSDEARSIIRFIEGRDDWKSVRSHTRLYKEYVSQTGSSITLNSFYQILWRLGYATVRPSIGDTSVRKSTAGRVKYVVKVGDGNNYNNWERIPKDVYDNNESVPNCALAYGLVKSVEKEARSENKDSK